MAAVYLAASVIGPTGRAKIDCGQRAHIPEILPTHQRPLAAASQGYLNMRKILDLALAGTNAAAASPLFRAMLPCTLVCSLIGGATALADSKSSAEFTLATCLAAMDDLASVEVLAKKNNWTDKTPANSAAGGKFTKSLSMWEVKQGEDKFDLQIWVNQFENLPPLNVCAVLFADKNMKREEFFNFISASVGLTFKPDASRPQSELYEIKAHGQRRSAADRLGVYITISSRSDGTLMSAILSERPRF
jgi:hypothetical protein